MLYGMGMVFLFLSLVVLCIHAISKFAGEAARPVSPPKAIPAADRQPLPAALAAAVHFHRRRNHPEP